MYLLSGALRVTGDTAVIDEVFKVTMSLFDVFGGCLNGWVIRDIDHDTLHGIFDFRGSREGFEGFAVHFGNTAANEDTTIIRRYDEVFGILKADTLVRTCTVFSHRVEGRWWRREGLRARQCKDVGTCEGEDEG